MLSKTSAYVKSYYGRNKWMYPFNEDNDLLKIILFGIKSALIYKNNLTAACL